MIPSLFIFGPQANPSCEDLAKMRSHLLSNPKLYKLAASIRDLPKLWFRLAEFDPELAQVPGESLLSCLAGWVVTGHADSDLGAFFERPSDLPAILSCPLNFIFQIIQYHSLLAQQVNTDNAHQTILQELRAGGVHGFCIGFLCAFTVASSGNDDELIETAIRSLRLAVCIGAYVDKDAMQRTHQRAVCISVRGMGRQVEFRGLTSKLLQDIPNVCKRLHSTQDTHSMTRHDVHTDLFKTYISASTDDASLTITTSPDSLSNLTDRLVSAGYTFQKVPVCGRFHCYVYGSEVSRLIDFFDKNHDLRLPSAHELHVAVRSAVDGKIIEHGNLIKYSLENILLKPVDWYMTLKLALSSLPCGHRSVALAGISTHFPRSLRNPDLEVRVLSFGAFNSVNLDAAVAGGFRTNNTQGSTHQLHLAPHSVEAGSEALIDSDDDGVLSLEDGCNTNAESSTRSDATCAYPPHAVAVVGMAGKFPGANSVDELWDLISSGRSMVSRAPDRVGLNQLKDEASPANWWGNFLEDYDTFDHKFFNKSTRDATACDPQQRKLLEVVYEALESSGQLGADAGSVTSSDYGCYIGAVTNNYATNISCHPATAYAVTGTTRAFLSGAISHYFGWTGPAMTIDTACSSSLVSIHLACRAIATGECSRAIAGGTNIITCPHDYRDLQAAGFLSPSGQCKPFDAEADGYCRGEAVGVVVLKSLSAAIEEHDQILGVIVGSATSQNDNDGPIVVPNAKSQAALLKDVIGKSGVSPRQVTYVEAHGTGTSVGDPIEVSSLREAFGEPSRVSTLHFSSIKGNIGHAEAASGVAGLIKVLLMMKNKYIPPQASFHSLNPKIPALELASMAIPQQLTPWHPHGERIACVNNYGAAGSNSVVMMREAPAFDHEIDSTNIPKMDGLASVAKWPLILTASSQTSLSLMAEKLLTWLRQDQPADSRCLMSVPNVLFNLAHRANHSLNQMVTSNIGDMADLESVLSAVALGKDKNCVATTQSPSPAVIMVFGGQEGRFVGLSEAVFKSSHILRHHVDKCHNLALSLGLIEVPGLYPAIFQQAPIESLVTLHVALFTMQYACAKAWMDCGLKVAAVIGHSFGHLTALCVSGVLSLADALRLVAGRASLMQRYWGSEPGAMLALQADRHYVMEMLSRVASQQDGYAEVACFNGPRSQVVVGSKETIQEIETLVASSQTGASTLVRSHRLNVTHGFHSKYTETLLPKLSQLVKELQWKVPTIHLELCDELGGSGAKDSDHYRDSTAQHARRPVYFQDAVERLTRMYPKATWLEAGRGSSIIQLVRACARRPEQCTFLAPRLTTSYAQDSLVDVTSSLWKEGHAVQYWAFHRSQRWRYQTLSLPAYQFQKNRHWLPFISSTSAPSGPSEEKVVQQDIHEIARMIEGDKSSSETVFHVSPPGSKRFESLVAGHVLNGCTLVPASAYIEIASRAALNLQGDLEAEVWVPTVEDLAMKAPIAGLRQDQARPYITMTMRRLENTFSSWSFVIKVQPYPTERGNISSVETFESATGLVHLHKRDNPHSQVAQDLRRFSALTGYSRWDQIMNDPEAEGMRGKHIYRTFSQAVEYSEAFWGVKTISCLGTDAAGTVKILPNIEDPADQRLTDSHMIDSFMQFGGILANFFNEAASPLDSLFVCHHIQRLQLGPTFSPDSQEWFVLAHMSSMDREMVVVDVYIFDTKTRTLVSTALGMSFSKMSRTSLNRVLGNCARVRSLPTAKMANDIESHVINDNSSATTSDQSCHTSSKRPEVLKIIASVADLPEDELSGDAALMGILDSLGATEVIGDIRSRLNVTIDLSTFLLFSDINAIISHVDSRLDLAGRGVAKIIAPPMVIATDKGTSHQEDCGVRSCMRVDLDHTSEVDDSKPPMITSIHKHFDEVRLTFDELGKSCEALDYWSEIHPDDVRLVAAYTIEALRTLGCDIRALEPNAHLPPVVGVLPRHEQLVNRLHCFLEYEGVIHSTGNDGFRRSIHAIDPTPAEEIFHAIVNKHPSNAATRHLLRAVGPHMGPCLKGHDDALQILFGDRSNKSWLDKLYRDWPMLVTATHLLKNFLSQCFTENSHQSSSGTCKGPFRILEVGAGTGGTTRYIVDHLVKYGIPFEYYFTDISGSLVQKAKISFKNVDGMKFDVLNIETDPPHEYIGAFHAIISTNCIHATRNLPLSLGNLRKMLREDGVVALIEMTPSVTNSLYVMDVIFGLLEGWWLFNDGRSHALADVDHWKRAFMEAGFEDVQWSDGATLEAKTVRVVCGFRKPRVKSDSLEGGKNTGNCTDVKVQEVVYKTVGSQDLHADIYCPIRADPHRKMPIGEPVP